MRDKLVFFWPLLAGLLLFCPALLAQEENVTPAELNRKAYFLLREARKAEYEQAERPAYNKYQEVVEIYRRISREFPDWNPAAVRAGIEESRKRAETLGEKIFQLPEGWIRIWPGMTYEGKRYYKGQALISRVEAIGENKYDVNGFTVNLSRSGPLLGAECNCPDYKYRGSKYNFACKHIWAVILKEGLIGDKSTDGVGEY